MVTRVDRQTEKLQVVAVWRKGEWALPGAICRDGEELEQAAQRKMKEYSDEEHELEEMVQQLFARGKPIFEGHVDDPRNTDNAWLETTAMHFHCGDDLGSKLPLSAKLKAGWKNAEDDEFLRQMYANHSEFVRVAVAALQGGWKLESWCETLQPQDLIATALRKSAPPGESELEYISSFKSRDEVANALMNSSDSLMNSIIDSVWQQSQVLSHIFAKSPSHDNQYCLSTTGSEPERGQQRSTAAEVPGGWCRHSRVLRAVQLLWRARSQNRST